MRMMMLASALMGSLARLQDYPPQELPGGTGLWLFGGLLVYVYVAFCFMTIANKTGTENSWFAWIPILNLVLILQIARKPLWWMLLLLIPLVNIVIYIITLVGVCEARDKSPWLTVALLLPVINLAAMGYLAFSD